MLPLIGFFYALLQEHFQLLHEVFEMIIMFGRGNLLILCLGFLFSFDEAHRLLRWVVMFAVC